MNFRAYDSERDRNVVTEIRSADARTGDTFVQTWVPAYIMTKLRDFSLTYALFKWDLIIRMSLTLGSKYQCYAAYTGSRLDGLICLSVNDEVRVDWIATAPWNYGKNGRMRRIGSGLLFFVMRNSAYIGRDGKFGLYPLKDAEPFYQQIGMGATGGANQEGLKEYRMTKDDANFFMMKFEEYLIEE